MPMCLQSELIAFLNTFSQFKNSPLTKYLFLNTPQRGKFEPGYSLIACIFFPTVHRSRLVRYWPWFHYQFPNWILFYVGFLKSFIFCTRYVNKAWKNPWLKNPGTMHYHILDYGCTLRWHFITRDYKMRWSMACKTNRKKHLKHLK